MDSVISMPSGERSNPDLDWKGGMAGPVIALAPLIGEVAKALLANSRK